MSLYRYASECNVLKRELIDSLTASEIELLRKEISTTGAAKWKDWFLTNHQNLQEYVAAPPSKRRTLKKWRDPYLKRHLVFGGVIYLTQAYFFLSRADAYGLHPGGSYRDMAGEAGVAYWDVRQHKLAKEEFWPFDDPSPFLEDTLNAPFF